MQSSSPRHGDFGEWKTPTRVRVLDAHTDQHLSNRQISKLTGVPRSTVGDIIRSGNPRRVGSGRKGAKHKVTERIARRLIRLLRTNWRTRCLPFKQLLIEANIDLSPSTARRALAKRGYRRCVACPRPFITQKQQKRRLQFAIEHIYWTIEVLRRVI